jgi:hypothetical protein
VVRQHRFEEWGSGWSAGGTRTTIALVAVLALGEACGAPVSTPSANVDAPTGPILEQVGVEPRCGEGDSSCFAAALMAAEQLALELGPEAQLPDVPVSGFTITVQRDPPFRVRTADGVAADSQIIAVDLTEYLLGIGKAVARVSADESGPLYEVPDAAAERLVSAIYVRTASPEPS